jgi:hypothetical protein
LNFFTPELYEAENETGNWDDIFAATKRYDEYTESIKSRLHPSVAAVAESRWVDDALLAKAGYDRKAKTLTITLRCGGLPWDDQEYFDLAFSYQDAEISEQHLSILAEIAEGTISAIRHWFFAWRHEVDVLDDGRFEQRISFHRVGGDGSLAWFAVKCKELTCERTDRESRDLPRVKQRFVVK